MDPLRNESDMLLRRIRIRTRMFVFNFVIEVLGNKILKKKKYKSLSITRVLYRVLEIILSKVQLGLILIFFRSKTEIRDFFHFYPLLFLIYGVPFMFDLFIKPFSRFDNIHWAFHTLVRRVNRTQTLYMLLLFSHFWHFLNFLFCW